MRFAFFACLLLFTIPAPAPAQGPARNPRPAIYELRTYYPAPGKLAALNTRFRDHTVALFAKHGMRNVAYWNEQPTKDAPEGRVIYVLEYPSRAARDKAWEAFGRDPVWQAVVAKSEAGGTLVSKVDSVFMTLADYSPPLAPPPTAQAQVPAGYGLVWSDEFNAGGKPDPAKWSYDTHANKSGWYNKELQYYSADRPENARVEDGKLIITARKERLADRPDHGGQNYTSARLITKGKAEWTYGFIEVRAKLPCGKGSWPAIWMLGAAAGWPDGGEIDIMEHVGKLPGDVFGTVHNRSTVGTHGKGGQIRVPDSCDAFHDYQIDWTPDAISFAVDGKFYHRYENEKKGIEQWPFDKPQYLLLNLAIGGAMAGEVDDSIFPIRFEIDHVRVYQRKLKQAEPAVARN